MDSSISLNKFISDTGYCSRREADQLIEEGRVFVNNKLATLGNRYTVGDVVEVDGSIVKPAKKEKAVYIVLNKPAGITTTSEAHIPGNIIAFVNHPKRIFPIGRLDKDSEGIIFLTNDGDIVNKILRANNKHEKEYIVKLNRPAEQGFAAKMSSGVPILGVVTAPCKVKMMGRQNFSLTLTQGLNRQIRRMCDQLGYSVTSLQRIRIMNIELGNLPLGKWRNMSEAEIEVLKNELTHSDKTAAASPKAKKARREPRKTIVKEEPKPAPKVKPVAVEAKKGSSYKEFRKRGRG